MDEERQTQVSSVVRRALLFLIAFAVVVALGTYVLVHSLGLNGSGDGSTSVVGQPKPVSPLPSTALPVPGDPASSSPEGAPSGHRHAHRHHRAAKGLHLSASPAMVAPMGRINLTGTWPGHDNVGLQVQRLENGSWSDFPITTTVQVGTFETYVRTGRSGVNEFRVVDPATHTASNSVRVTVS